MKPEKEMTHDEFKEYFFESKYFKSLRATTRVATKLMVIVWRFVRNEPYSVWKYQWRFNPFNPLTYLVIVGIIIVGIMLSVFQFFKDVTDESFFKWK